MKKLFAVLSLSAFAFFYTGCSSSSDSGSDNNDPDPVNPGVNEASHLWTYQQGKYPDLADSESFPVQYLPSRAGLPFQADLTQLSPASDGWALGNVLDLAPFFV